MPITTDIDDGGIAEVVMDNPPVNALTVAGWFELADTIRALGQDPAVRVVILRAEGRGFNAGVDIKEMQATEGFTRWWAPTGAATPPSPPSTSAPCR